MRRIVGLQTELVLTTALLVGAALLFGGFLLLRLTEQKLIEQQIKYVRSSVQMISYALSPNKPENQVVSREQLQQLLIELDLELNEWELFGQFMQPAKGLELTNIESLRPRPLAHQARFAPGPQLQIDYPEIWLPFQETSTGSIESAIAIQDSAHNFAGVVWLQFSLKDVNQQITETRRLVFMYVFLYGLVLTAFGIIVLSRNVVRPVNRLREATALIATGDLTTHVKVDGPREIKELGQSFNLMTDALRKGRDEILRSERMASVGHLSAGMAHEIGNPLAAIIGYLEILKVDIDDEAQRDLVQRSIDETARIDRLVRDLLDYATPAEVIANAIDLCLVLNETVQTLQSQAAFTNYSIVSSCPDSLPVVNVNPHKLTQVLVNLISNSRDASVPGSIIEVSAAEDGGEVVVMIRDQGEGIDAATRAQIFDPFFSTKREGEGRGLGLTICHRIVEEAGGRIDVVSEPQRGSTFFVRLPKNDGKRT